MIAFGQKLDSINGQANTLFPSHLSVPRDSVRLDLESAEKTFLARNFLLLAQHFNINVQQAQIIQARLWTNPNISGSLLIENYLYKDKDHPGAKRFFDLTSTGEQSFNIQQLFVLAGKRRKQVDIAKENSLQAEYQFYDLVRTLKAQLRTDFYTIYYNQQSLSIYSDEIRALSNIARAYDQLISQGFVAKKEVLRLKAQLFSLQNELIALRQQIMQSEGDMNTLLTTKGKYYVPVVKSDPLKVTEKNLSYSALLDSAYLNRYDLKSAEATVKSSEINYRLQRALAWPDVTIGYGFDRHGSYIPSSKFLSVGIDLPVFNRNQGNIRGSEYTVKLNQAQYENQKNIISSDLSKAMASVIDNETFYKSFDQSFQKDYGLLVEQVLINYKSRNIGLLDFLNYYDSFKQNVLQFNILQLNLKNAYEQVNFAVGKDIIH